MRLFKTLCDQVFFDLFPILLSDILGNRLELAQISHGAFIINTRNQFNVKLDAKFSNQPHAEQ